MKRIKAVHLLSLIVLINISVAFAADFIVPTTKVPESAEKGMIAGYKKFLKNRKLNHRPPLVWTAVEGEEWFLKVLIKHGEKIDEEEERGGNALSAAILNKREGIFNILIESGADINFTYSNKMNGVRPITLAAQVGNTVMLNRLLELGVDVNYTAPDKYRTTPLYTALFHNNGEAARILIKAGSIYSPYRTKSGQIPEPVRRNSCNLKKQFPQVFKELKCNIDKYRPKPGFPCSKAATTVEKTICGSKLLSIFDAELSKVYRWARKERLNGVVLSQKRWLENRNACELKKEIRSCLHEQYKARIRELTNGYLEHLFEKTGKFQAIHVTAVKLSDEKIMYLLSAGQYRFGIISNKYYLGFFEGPKFGKLESFCSARFDEESKVIDGDKDCWDKPTINKFAAL